MKYVIALTVVMFSIISCNKPVYKYNPDFEGQWRTVSAYDSIINETVASEIVIDGKDGAYYNSCRDTCTEHLCDCIVTQSGKAVMNSSKDQMKLGSSNYAIGIQQEPTQDANGNWSMIIDNKTFYKIQ